MLSNPPFTTSHFSHFYCRKPSLLPEPHQYMAHHCPLHMTLLLCLMLFTPYWYWTLLCQVWISNASLLPSCYRRFARCFLLDVPPLLFLGCLWFQRHVVCILALVSIYQIQPCLLPLSYTFFSSRCGSAFVSTEILDCYRWKHVGVTFCSVDKKISM